jgi:hypothetical protein
MSQDKDTARYLLDSFLNSHNSHDFDLDHYDLIILYAITYYIDLDKNGKNSCCAKQTTLASRSRIDRKVVNRRINKLKKMNLIRTERKWKLLWISLGENILVYLPGTLSSTSQVHDPVPTRYTTIEKKKQSIRERQQQEVVCSFDNQDQIQELELIDTAETVAVESFINNLFGVL